jgi:predicted deacylase
MVLAFSTALVMAVTSVIMSTVPAEAEAGAPTSALPSGRTDYRTLADYEGDMSDLARRHPYLVKPITLPERTPEGRVVHGIEITENAAQRDGKPVLLITGMHHGTEWASGEVSMEFGTDLVRNYGRDRQITGLLDRARIVIVPIVNVDGFVHNTRRNANNVDMNRNYGFGWGESAPYQGAAPWSEPETRNVRDLISSRQVTTFLTMHTCLANMLYPPLQHKAGLPQDIDAFRSFAGAMGTQNGYYHTTSADDYETTGESIDWSYYATRGLGVTVEVCSTPLSLPRTFQTLVVDQYLGTNGYEGKGIRGSFLTALEQASDRTAHSVITGEAPHGAVLRVSKDFPLWTNPVAQPDGSTRPLEFPNHLSSTMEVGDHSGRFTWDVNPSLRPVPPYQADGVHTQHPGFVPESWTLTCARPDGTVLQTVNVRVDRGKQAQVDLERCRDRFRQKGEL